MDTVPKQIKETILKFNSLENNDYSSSKFIVKNFLEHYAKKYDLQVSRVKSKKIVKLLYKDDQIGYMKGLKSSSTKQIAFNLCKDKFLLEEHLIRNNINTLKSKYFEEKEEAIHYVKQNNQIKYVVKPPNLAGGLGIILNIDARDIEDAWNQSVSIQKQNGVENPSCIIQPYVEGFDIRVSIIEGKYSCALLRLPAHVVGNGKDTIENLINAKNIERKKIPYFKTKLIPIDGMLDKQLNKKNLKRHDIPDNNEVIVINEIANLTLGGESIDITDIISDKIIDLSLNAAASVPGLYSTGVDIMTEDFINGEGYIIEMNTNANLTMHHLPLKGMIRRPYECYVKNVLTKYKVRNRIKLNESETEIYSYLDNFYNLKDNYAAKLAEYYLEKPETFTY